MPAAACAWPMLDFSEPSLSGRLRGPGRRWPAAPAPRSGRRALVPVPCASTASTSARPSPAFASASRITRSCDGPFGAVRPLLAPSWLTAVPRITPRIRCPLRCASDRRSSTTQADALGPGRAVGAGAEGLAAAVHGQPALAAEVHEHRRRREHRDARAERHLAFALAQRLAGQVQRDQRRRAGRVDGQRRAFEAEDVGRAGPRARSASCRSAASLPARSGCSTSSPTCSRPRTRRSGCRAARRARCRRARAPPSRPPAAAAAAGPWPAPRAG